jgi:hypothetical protein
VDTGGRFPVRGDGCEGDYEPPALRVTFRFLCPWRRLGGQGRSGNRRQDGRWLCRIAAARFGGPPEFRGHLSSSRSKTPRPVHPVRPVEQRDDGASVLRISAQRVNAGFVAVPWTGED